MAALCARDPMTEDDRPGGVIGHGARCKGSRLGVQDRSLLFLTVPFGRKVITLHGRTVITLGPARCRYRPWKARVHVRSP